MSKFRFVALFATAIISPAFADTNNDVSPEPLPLQYGRENSLPLCEWGNGDRGFPEYIYLGDKAGVPGHWDCRDMAKGKGSKCTFPSPPDCGTPGRACPPDDTFIYKPENQSYLLKPIQTTPMLEWPDGSALYGVSYLTCANSGPADARDVVLRALIRGDVLSVVDGGVVEHVRPALVRGTVTIMLPTTTTRLANDLTLAIQILGDNAWEDVATATRTVEKNLGTFEVEATVPEYSDVRLQIRSNRPPASYGAGYDLRDARIFVETCIPDQNQPGTCLGD